MKIANGYMLKEIAGNYVVIPVGQNIVDYKSMLHLNETGAFIWKQMEAGSSYDEIVTALMKEYEATEDERSIITSDLDEFISQMNSMQLLSDEATNEATIKATNEA